MQKMSRIIKAVPGIRNVVRTSRQLRQRFLLGPGWPIQRRRLMRHPRMSLSKFASACLRNGDVVFDIGASTGNLALLMASCVGKSGFVCAFEPNPICFSKLAQSAKSAWNRNLHTYLLALSDTNGPLTLLIDLREGACASTIVTEHARRETALHKARYSPTSVVATTLDAFCETSDFVPTFLKIDVEGAEEMVIRGGEGVIAAHRPLIWFECWCGLEGSTQINQHLGHFEQLSDLGYNFFLATLFSLNGRWVTESDRINSTQLLPFEPQMLDSVSVLGCDILAVTPDHLDRLHKCGLISGTDAKSHILGFSYVS